MFYCSAEEKVDHVLKVQDQDSLRKVQGNETFPLNRVLCFFQSNIFRKTGQEKACDSASAEGSYS